MDQGKSRMTLLLIHLTVADLIVILFQVCQPVFDLICTFWNIQVYIFGKADIEKQLKTTIRGFPKTIPLQSKAP